MEKMRNIFAVAKSQFGMKLLKDFLLPKIQESGFL